MGYDCGDSFSSDFEPNEISFGLEIERKTVLNCVFFSKEMEI